MLLDRRPSVSPTGCAENPAVSEEAKVCFERVAVVDLLAAFPLAVGWRFAIVSRQNIVASLAASPRLAPRWVLATSGEQLAPAKHFAFRVADPTPTFSKCRTALSSSALRGGCCRCFVETLSASAVLVLVAMKQPVAAIVQPATLRRSVERKAAVAEHPFCGAAELFHSSPGQSSQRRDWGWPRPVALRQWQFQDLSTAPSRNACFSKRTPWLSGRSTFPSP